MSAQSKLRLKRRIHVVLLAVMMVLFSVAASAPTQTSAETDCVWYKWVKYHPNASKTGVCGGVLFLCDGTVVNTGCVSEYSTVLECTCGS